MSENNDSSNESNSRSGEHSILQAPRLGAACGGGSNPIIRSGVLRPSVLGSTVNSAIGIGAIAKSNNTMANPFMREHKIEETNEQITDGAVCGMQHEGIGDKAVGGEVRNNDDDDEEPDDRPDPLTLLRKNGIERANLFAAAKSSIPRVEKSGFVFGQNVHERVVGENISKETSRSAAEANPGSSSGELLFSSVIQNAAKSSESDNNTIKETEAKSLTDVAREYEESRAQKRKFEEVETFTGEENEVNIVDVNCKLFAFVNSNWEERGRGSLRLNDSKNEQECSRVVFRTSGNLRLLLNTKVWAGMVAERPSQKSLRLTAMDNTGKIKIFLLMARPVDISRLHKALVERIDIRKNSHPEECRSSVNDNNFEQSKNGTACALEHHNDEEGEDENGNAQAKSIEEKTTQDDLNEPSPKKPVLEEDNKS